ncbi:outer membrane protein assembly factor BamB [Colwellia hornerae]|uniref:Outer membrane protein assembly factor BamB n=1 Tax=Colwellia hornerae TaxID=89402 RepID=A0A5C6QUL2_9GAMM|nr:outer membrane protein assembly factor BamB [Colwellia hornerae]TWX56969.1 outer membrane protein assembly factor BamB [Colwellia hornerae]TWX62306.1 outer membrane protein assembly factor BamB [Colwellia hornerae]TWX72362.1 outer membrane protein assembly factor BamB [Colwellia hornerae]
MLKKLRFNKKLLAIALLSLGLGACSSTDEEDEATKVAELTEIKQAFEADVLWESTVGNGVSDYFSRIKPNVAYGKIYSASRDGDVVALELENGEEIWSTDLSDIKGERSFFDRRQSALLNGGPISGIQKIFIGSENGEVFALDADTGKLDWQGKVKGEVIAAPAIDAGILVVNTASGVIKAFNASNGQDEWQVEQEVPALTLRGVSSPAISSGGVMVGSANGTMSVYILESGQQGWTAEVGEAGGSTQLERVIDVDSAPLIYGDKVYSISVKGNLTAIDLRSGRMIWERQYSSYHDMAISGNTLFLTDIKGHVYAVDRLNGFEKWSQLALTNRGVTGPAVIGDYIVVGDFEGYLHFIDQTTGDILARHEVDSSGLNIAPTVHEDIIYAQSRNGDLQAIKIP